VSAAVRVGTSGWLYPPWRGTFYPKGLPRRLELGYLSHLLNSVEINGSFYALQRPDSYLAWRNSTADDFIFAVKGGRFITHMKRLREVHAPLANFFASGVLALGDKLGPVLWQLPPTMRYDPEQLSAFFALLPRTTSEAARLAARHDQRLAGRAWTVREADRPVRHAMEVRHPSFVDSAVTGSLADLLGRHGIALVVADSAGTWPHIEHVTTDFVYVRLHGDTELYTSGYTEQSLDTWAGKVDRWRAAGHDVYVYFDNDAKVKAPGDAIALARRLGLEPQGTTR
jgi:uncharacterized protein YecE (DUF72 family)